MTILVLGAGEGQVPLIQRAKDAGWYIIVVSPFGNYPGFEIADKCVYADLTNRDFILSIAKAFNIDAVATDQTDISVSTVQYVAEALSLPHIHCRDIENFRVKSRMRQICESAGIPTITYFETSDYAAALSFYYALSNDAIIKPVDSQGSRGVHLIKSKDDFAYAFHDAMKYSKSGAVIIEKFIRGQEIEVDTIISEGIIHTTIIGDVYNFNVKDTFSAYERIYPSALDRDTLSRITERNEQTLHALGLVTGWSHGEYIVSDNGEIYLLEVGARGGGNFIGSDIIKIMCGVGTDEMAFQTARGDKSFYDQVHLQDVFCAYKCFYLPEGTVSSIIISDDFYSKEYIIRHNLDHLKIGMETSSNTDKTSRFTIVLKAQTREQLHHYLQEITQMIHVIVIDSHGQNKGIIWK